MRPIRITAGGLAIGPGVMDSASGGGPSGPPKPKSLPGRFWDWVKGLFGKKR